MVIAVPPDLGYGEEGNPDAGIKRDGHPLLRHRRPGHGLSGAAWRHGDRRARASGCSTCSSCCWSSAATSARTGSGRSSTRTPASDAFEKMFERDKEELRSLGVPIEVGQMDAYFDDEPGYRVQADLLALPDISLTADEVAVVGLATKVWQHAKLARATTEAVRKLTALGADLDVSALDIVEPRLNADEPSFDVFLEATQERQAVTFGYRRPGQTESDDPAPPAVGRHPLLRSLVRRRLRHRPRGRAGVPALAGRGSAPQGRCAPAPTRSRPTSTSARWPAGSRRRSPPSGSCCSCGRGPGCPCVAVPTSWTPASPVRTARPAGTALAIDPRARAASPTRSSRFGPDVVVEEPAGGPPAGRRPARPPRWRGRSVTATAAVGAKDQVARLLTLVPYLKARGEVRLDEAAAALGVSRRAAAQGPQGPAGCAARPAACPTTSSTSTSPRWSPRTATGSGPTGSSGSPTRTTSPSRCG